MPSTLTPPMSMVPLRPDLPGRSPSTAARSEMQLGTEATRGLRADTKRGTRTATSYWADSGSLTFIGTVCAPYDNFTFSGSAGAMGSFSANTVTISGGAAVHYDENLGGGTDPQYVVSSWNEI